MPNTKAAKKRLRQNITRRVRNRSWRTALRNQIKKVGAALESANVEASEAEFRVAVKKLDQAAAKRLIHRNAAARTKSRLSAKVKALKNA
ncbi:MAG: 30S ribosomal protein S20 [Planctomycetales bacterium]